MVVSCLSFRNVPQAVFSGINFTLSMMLEAHQMLLLLSLVVGSGKFIRYYYVPG